MSLSLVGAGAWSSGVTTGAPNASYPAVTINAGDIAVYQLNIHKATARTEDVGNIGDVNAAGWELRLKRSGNTQSTATDTGECMIAYFTKLMAGGESGGTPAEINISGNTTGTSGTSAAGRIKVFRRSAGIGWWIAGTDGTDDTTGTAWDITFGANPGIRNGDILVYGNVLPTDTNPTYGSESLAASGATIGAANDEATLSIAAGVDAGGKSAWRSVTAGEATAAPTWTATLSGTTTNASGPAALLRLREAMPGLIIPKRQLVRTGLVIR